MAIKDTFKQMRDLLSRITIDLDKSENGNKAASQRVRTGTVRLEKVAKLFRKESIHHERKTKGAKKSTKAVGMASKGGKVAEFAGASSKMKMRPKASSASAKPRTASFKARPKAKAMQVQASFSEQAFSAKRATAKLPTRPVFDR